MAKMRCVQMMCAHATHGAGGFGLEAGIMAMLDRMKTGSPRAFWWNSDGDRNHQVLRRNDSPAG